ncbi:hypothetical protein [Leptolyngbya ohadii]|uniref:hypothetical protein n=1 Tax=Leptolyngbya ohadii TaxID=1962290 RepID=UPI001CEC40A7|nr:hypothetical protein [Leptolyngbya ohadii]
MVALTCVLSTVTATKASTALPMHLTFDEGMMAMVVPDTNTTASAYGGQLRVYDVHIAKMFEVTHNLCQTGRVGGGIGWSYFAGNGSINMGNFQISCDLAANLSIAYGLGAPERTVIHYAGGDGYAGTVQTFDIPIFNITGEKVSRWMSFVQNFRPTR